MESRYFNNGFEGEELEKAEAAIERREEDIRRYMNDCELYENGDDDLPPFCEYGLCFDYVEAEEDKEDYYRFQISWGGPSFEFRIYEDGEVYSVFMDWFKGLSQRAPRDVEESLFNEFEGMLDFD